MEERISLQQQWILPLIVYPARVVYPKEQVISTLRTVYQVALRLNSWSITLSVLSLPKVKGGHNLPTPTSFLLWQHASSYVHFHKSLHVSLSVQPFPRLGQKHWSGTYTAIPPLLSNGVQRDWETMPSLGWCVSALSLLRQDHPAPTPYPMPYNMPLWHNLLFHNAHNQTYFCPRLIRVE